MGDGMTDIRDALSLRKIINAAGPVSVLGGGAPGAAATAAALAILPHAVEIAQLHAIASRQIAQAFGCEAGCVAACSAAGITIAVAAAITGLDRERVVRLPDTGGRKHRVVMQRGHDCNFGAQVSQMIRLAGAALDLIGTTERCSVDDLRRSLRGDVAAAVYVVSHHTAQTGMIDLRSFCLACHAAGVPVIVDAAGEHDLRDYLGAGADIAIASAHKNYGALTAGIVAGRGALIDAMLLQDEGIGRPMKVGKEAIAAVIAALEEWRQQDHQAVRTAWTRRAAIALDTLADVAGLTVELAPDMAASPLLRARIHVGASAALTADRIAQRLADGDPSIRVWRAGLPHGYFELDPRTITDDEMLMICRTILTLVQAEQQTASA
jgi:D-glucosaminate-6-phosphate ammonia-lyase